MIESGFNYSDIYVAGLKYGYEDFVAISRHALATNGPVVQYADTTNENTDKILLPAKDFKNNAEQSAIYDTKLLGEGYDTTSYKTSKLVLKPSFETPILCSTDNVPADYVFELFDIAKKSIYGDAIEHVARITSVSGVTVTMDSSAKYLIKNLKVSLLAGHTLYMRIVDGHTLKSLSSLIEVSSLSANTAVATLSTSPGLTITNRYALAVFIFYKAPTYPLTQDIPPSRQGYEYSNEFYLHSSRDGLYYPSLIDSISFNIDSNQPTLSVATYSKRLNTADRLILPNQSLLPSSYTQIYSAPKCEQARIKISDVSGRTLFYGLMPVIQSGTIPQSSSMFEYKTGIHFGNDLEDLASPVPLLIKSMSISIHNNLNALYSTHTPRFSFTTGEEYINDLGRHDNMCAYGLYSTKRTISGNIAIYIPQDEWFKKEFFPAVSSNTEGSIEIDTGYINFTLSKLVFNLSPMGSQIQDELTREAMFSFASSSYQAMFEIGLSKTGGRL